MPKPTRDLHLDFETYCDLDLRKVGVYRYVEHPSFRILTAAWKLGGGTTRHAIMYPVQWMAMPLTLVMALADKTVQGHAWNAAFETAVLARIGVVPVHPLSCTMQRALAYGLPGKLEQAALALGVQKQKNMAGHRLMLKMSRPLKEGALSWTPADFDLLAAYCADDVNAEEAIAQVIPELPPEEAALSTLDALMNVSGGLAIDETRVRTLQGVANAAERVDAARCAALTSGAVTSPGTQTARLLEWLEAQGCGLPDLSRATVEETLTQVLPNSCGISLWPEEVVEVLQIRLRAARASTKKLQRMLDMARSADGALQGQFQFLGAPRTGRWSGRGVQPQNLPRVPKGFDPDLFMRLAEQAIYYPGALDAISPAPVGDCVSWSLRSCLRHVSQGPLWSFDFSQIEARVLAWLAGQQDVLAVFASGQDVYVWAAAQFGSSNRQLGKVLVLALGFGMGATKLQETARKQYGLSLTMSEAEKFKTGWRLHNHRIVSFWYEIEEAARQAIVHRGRVVAVGGSGVAFQCTARTLQMRLPSGRVLYYHRPRVSMDDGSITYWGADIGGRFAEQRTWGGKLAENATQAAARDVMSEAMLRMWRRLLMVPAMTVHDDLTYPIQQGDDVSEYEQVVLEAPPWGGGLPIAGESKIVSRYGVAL